jgi:uncharacterized protein YfaP (DUF2135 family)
VASNAAQTVSKQGQYEQISKASYFLSARRRAARKLLEELLDWLEAERAVDLHLALPRGHVHSPDETCYEDPTNAPSV